ncbi:MAG: N-acetylneuraminate synthase family protein [Flavobacteriales bacterium]|nr:N-acetylneuraminate synthase family protein [Flavobacteriales bacterium]
MFIIAEIAQAHEGSLGIAHSYIDALAETGVDAVKFQTHIAEAESSPYEPFRVKFSYEDDTRMEYWKRMEFTPEQWKGLKMHCEEKGMEFISSPFSIAAVDLLEEIGVRRYKIGSGEMRNFLMLKKIALTGKPIILSSGMSDWDELDETIGFLKPFGNQLSLLQCTTAYPTAPEQWNLQNLLKMKERYAIPVGFSDHSAGITAGLAATALGAEILEFHVVFDKKMFGPDAKASLNLEETAELVKGCRQINTSLGSYKDKNDVRAFGELKVMFGKSLSVNKDLKAGHTIIFEDLESKKPGDKGIPAGEFDRVVGKKLTRDKLKWDFIEDADLN